MSLLERARIHAALGDPHRLAIVDELGRSDRTFDELARLVKLPSNAAAHHIRVLETAGVIERRVSEGDRRRRYITLRPAALGRLLPAAAVAPGTVLFVCTRNSARSPFAAALWAARTGGVADSAGAEPASRVHPRAVRTGASFGLDLAGVVPKGYDGVTLTPDLVISVCDRARESSLPFGTAQVHWSVPDPVATDTDAAFRRAFSELAERIDRLAQSVSVS